MKGKTKHILGVALTLMLMVSLLCWAAPVSADTLEWDDEDIPEELEESMDILDLAVAEGGVVIYATTGLVEEYVGVDDALTFELADSGGGAVAEWSTEQMHDGRQTVKLSVPEPEWADIEFQLPDPGIKLSDLDLEGTYFWCKSTNGSRIPYFWFELGDDEDRRIGHDAGSSTGFTADWAKFVASSVEDPNWQDHNDAWQTWEYIKTTYGDEYITAVLIENADITTNDPWPLTAFIDDVVINGASYGLKAPIYVSDDTGESWEDATVVVDSDILSADFVAVSPDDPRYIAVANKCGTVYISDDNGATWETLGDSGVNFVADIAVSVESGGNRFVAVVGDDGDGNAEVFYYEIGALGAGWEDMTLDGGFTAGQDKAGAVAFSPKFDSDQIMVAVTADFTTEILFQMYSFNHSKWNADAGFSDYPVPIVERDNESCLLETLDSASISLSPDYLGNDDDLRIAFVGLATGTEDDGSGIFRLDDDDVETLKDEKFIHSVDFDGTDLVAGRFDDTDVYRSDDPLASSPDVSGSSATKCPGGESRVVVAFADDSVVAGTSGDESSFAVSRNNGKTFNDISLIDTTLDTLSDVALSADGSVVYLVTADADPDLSVWRFADDVWERVFSDQDAAADYIVRLAPDDAAVVYLADVGGSAIYYSSDTDARWQTRTSRYDIGDLAVETDGDVSYVLEDSATACYVSRSENTGFTWGGKEVTGLSDGSNMIVSLGEDLVLVGSADGTASYSTDGNESWTDLDQLDDNEDNVQVTASGLADGDFIYASTGKADSAIYLWEIGDGEWDDFATLDVEGAEDEDSLGFMCTGIALGECGTLYVLAVDDGTIGSRLYRFLDPEGDGTGDESITTADEVLFDRTPSALRMSTGSTNLWAIGVDLDDASVHKLFNFEDTIAKVAPPLRGPKDGFTVPINEISGEPADVNLTWKSPSDEVEAFDLEVALDDEFDEVVYEPLEVASGDFEGERVIEGGDDEGDVIAHDVSGTEFMPDETYYWRVRVSQNAPVQSPWSDTWSFTVAEAEGVPPVTLEIPPAPEITVEMPAPEVTVTVPPMVQVPPAPAPTAPGILWAVIIIGALLVIALIVLILRTRRVV